ncbi:MAG: MATE family efflux transporter [Erysipelotrichaceae bacterium]|nr:MATE family efflux transporter [Erysipelotrichaceae bacterium]MDY5251781.1 MATE family efflux transporter [Erysipelotrichaceae bacterium]
MSVRKSDKMANWPIGKLLYSMSLPAVFSMLIQAMYNIVDTMYVAQLGEKTLFAIGIAFPLQMVVLSIALGGGAGVGTIVARRLGEKRYEEANATVTTGFGLVLGHYILIVLAAIFLAKPFLALFTNDLEAIKLGYQYLIVVMGVSFGQLFAILCERILQSTGNMLIPTVGQLIGAITNIVLDPIFIFGWGFIPAMGITGAAIATVIGQVLALVFEMVAFLWGSHEVAIDVKNCHFDRERIKSIYGIGLPVAIMNAIGSLTTTALNGILVRFGESAVTTLTLYFKIQSFVFMPVFGFNQGSLPILSYNYGAKDKGRYFKTVKLYLFTAIGFMSLGMAIFWLATPFLINLFNPTPALFEVAYVAFRILALSFILAACTIVISAIFQSLGYGVSSMMISIMRQLGFLLPLALIFSHFWGVVGIWWAYPVAEALVVTLYAPLVLKKLRKVFA